MTTAQTEFNTKNHYISNAFCELSSVQRSPETDQILFIFKMFKLFVLFAVLATINAQFITPALTTQDQNIYRTYGNLGQVSTHSKTIDTPFSSVSKSDVRVSNPGIYGSYGVSPYAAVAHPYGLAAPAPYAYPRPLGLARPVAHAAIAPAGLLGMKCFHSKFNLGVAYSAAPAVAHMSYSNGLGLSYALFIF